jgi:hypothetical protein
MGRRYPFGALSRLDKFHGYTDLSEVLLYRLKDVERSVRDLDEVINSFIA